MSLLTELTDKLKGMSEKDKVALAAEIGRSSVGKMLWVPNPGPQTDAYFSPADLLYFGGAAGGGKSQLLLGLAVNEHTVSRLFRRQFKDIDGEGGLAPAMSHMLGSSAGYNSQKHVWTVPKDRTGGKRRAIEFAAFETPKEAEAYQGRAADFFGFDEVVHFQEDIVRFITAWNRTTIQGQRCRTVFASNPPVTADGLWVFNWFGPWLDPMHPKPAKPGELRWFAMVNGVEVEVDKSYKAIIVDAKGNEIEAGPNSRTFIPASLSDNPDLIESGYANQLAALPKHLQDALAAGKFSTTLEDADRQVIPTEWILKAQQRFTLRSGELKTKPMDALGCDVADGGKDRMVLVPRHGVVFDEPKTKPGVEVARTEAKAAFILTVLRDDAQINVDCGGGYGTGVSDLLENNKMRVKRIKGGSGSTAKSRDGREFENYRAQMIWQFREALDPDHGDDIALPPGREVLAELTAFRERPHGDMRSVIRIEPNEDIVKRIGRSPDIAWGFFFAWVDRDPMLSKPTRAGHVGPPVIHSPRAKHPWQTRR